MSVQGEYNRALEALLADLRRLDEPSAGGWVVALEATRPGRSPDLTAAAKDCLAVLESIDVARGLSSSSESGPDADTLRAPFLHLRAHCCAILGIPDSIVVD